MTKATENAMTIEEMKAAIAQADKAHKDYIAFCDANGIPVKGKRAKS